MVSLNPVGAATNASSLRERWRTPDVGLSEIVCTPDLVVGEGPTRPTTTIYVDGTVGNPRPAVLRVKHIGFQARGRRSRWGRRSVEDLSLHERSQKLPRSQTLPTYLQPGTQTRFRLMHSGYEAPRDIRVVVVFGDRLFRKRWKTKWTTDAFADEVARHNDIRQRQAGDDQVGE